MAIPDPELLTELVLRCVEAVPVGRVTTYGDIAAIIGCSPRIVGKIMTTSGDICWWRVVNASGRLPAHLVTEALQHWQHEATPLTAPDSVARSARIARDELTELARARLAELCQAEK